MGGTFMALPEDYRDYFIRNLHDALSGHSSNNVAEAVRLEQLDGFTCRPLRSSCVYITNRQSILECNLHTITIKTNCWEGLIFIDFINKMRRKMQKCVFKIMRFLQVLWEEPYKVYRNHDRNETRLLPETPLRWYAELRLHTAWNWSAVGLRRRGTGHEPRPHGQSSLREFSASQRCRWVQLLL